MKKLIIALITVSAINITALKNITAAEIPSSLRCWECDVKYNFEKGKGKMDIQYIRSMMPDKSIKSYKITLKKDDNYVWGKYYILTIIASEKNLNKISFKVSVQSLSTPENKEYFYADVEQNNINNSIVNGFLVLKSKTSDNFIRFSAFRETIFGRHSLTYEINLGDKTFYGYYKNKYLQPLDNEEEIEKMKQQFISETMSIIKKREERKRNTREFLDALFGELSDWSIDLL